MKEELKKRIQALRSRVIPEGYVDTPIGPLPANWRYARLGDIAEELTETAGNGAYETVSISAGVGFVNQAEKFGKELSGKQYEKYIVLHKGDFSYNKGNSNRYPQGCIYRLNDRETAAVPNVFESFRIVDGCPEYYEQLFISGFLNRQLYRLINHGVRDDGLLNLTGKDFYSCLLPVPPISEQEKIVSILKACDSMIELYWAKANQYQDLKKAFMELLFPKPGCLLPKLRFSGFTDDWEQRKLESLCDLFTDGDWIESKDQSDAGIRLVQTGNIGVAEYLDKPNNKKWISEDTFTRLNCTEVLPGDILISRLPEPAGRACIMPCLDTKMITAVDCTIVRASKEVSSEYLVQYLSTQAYFNIVNTCLAGGTRQRISRSNLADFDIPVPPEKAEQGAVGSFFTNLDYLITLHQGMSEEYQSAKAAIAQLLLMGLIRVEV